MRLWIAYHQANHIFGVKIGVVGVLVTRDVRLRPASDWAPWEDYPSQQHQSFRLDYHSQAAYTAALKVAYSRQSQDHHHNPK